MKDIGMTWYGILHDGWIRNHVRQRKVYPDTEQLTCNLLE